MEPFDTTGNNFYYYAQGMTNTTIFDQGGNDVLKCTDPDITEENLKIYSNGFGSDGNCDLFIKFGDSNIATIKNHCSDYQNRYTVEKYELEDGSTGSLVENVICEAKNAKITTLTCSNHNNIVHIAETLKEVHGGEGKTTYLWPAVGRVTVFDAGGNDIFKITNPNVTEESLKIYSNGFGSDGNCDLFIKFGDSNIATIKNHCSDYQNRYTVEKYELEDGSTGSLVENVICEAKNAKITTLTCSSHNNIVHLAQTLKKVNGGAGGDTYLWSGVGKITLLDAGGKDKMIIGKKKSEVSFCQKDTDLHIITESGEVIIENHYNWDSRHSLDSLEFSTGTTMGLINFSTSPCIETDEL